MRLDLIWPISPFWFNTKAGPLQKPIYFLCYGFGFPAARNPSNTVTARRVLYGIYMCVQRVFDQNSNSMMREIFSCKYLFICCCCLEIHLNTTSAFVSIFGLEFNLCVVSEEVYLYFSIRSVSSSRIPTICVCVCVCVPVDFYSICFCICC